MLEMPQSPTQKPPSFVCPKCKCTQFESGELRAAGSFWSKVFNIQGTKYATITCTQCRYTELYKDSNSSAASNLFDLLVGG